MCDSLRGIRVPSRFMSNIRKLVSMKDLSLCGYNCHDCHVLLVVFLPIAIRAIKPVFVKMVITRLCYFFNKVSQNVINKDELNDLQEFFGETMAQLEMCFPPSFFDNGALNDSHGRPDTCTWSTLPSCKVDVRAFHVHSKPVRTKSCLPLRFHDRGIQY